MKNKTITIASIIGILLVFGTASAMAHNMSSGDTGYMQNHKYIPEMMKNMNTNCPKNMTTSTVTNTMMGGGIINENNNGGCKDMNPGSMMGSGGMRTKGMM